MSQEKKPQLQGALVANRAEFGIPDLLGTEEHQAQLLVVHSREVPALADLYLEACRKGSLLSPTGHGPATTKHTAALTQACTCFLEELVSRVLKAALWEAKAQTLRCLLLRRRLCRGSCDMRSCRARRPAPRSKAVHARRLSRPRAHLKSRRQCCAAAALVKCALNKTVQRTAP